jgi:hypothetical protein
MNIKQSNQWQSPDIGGIRMKFAIVVVSMLVTLGACAQQPLTQSGALMAQQDHRMPMDMSAATPGAQSTPQQPMTGCMSGMGSGHGGMMSGQGGMMGCPMMSQTTDSKGMSCCCSNMGKEQPKDPA